MGTDHQFSWISNRGVNFIDKEVGNEWRFFKEEWYDKEAFKEAQTSGVQYIIKEKWGVLWPPRNGPRLVPYSSGWEWYKWQSKEQGLYKDIFKGGGGRKGRGKRRKEKWERRKWNEGRGTEGGEKKEGGEKTALGEGLEWLIMSQRWIQGSHLNKLNFPSSHINAE